MICNGALGVLGRHDVIVLAQLDILEGEKWVILIGLIVLL